MTIIVTPKSIVDLAPLSMNFALLSVKYSKSKPPPWPYSLDTNSKLNFFMTKITTSNQISSSDLNQISVKMSKLYWPHSPEFQCLCS